MKFGNSDPKLNKRLREVIQAEGSPLYNGWEADMEAFEALAKWLTESQQTPCRAVHDNCDGTARQCAAYFFGLRDATPAFDGDGRHLRHRVATATCRDSRKLKRPPRLYVLVRDGGEESLFAHMQHYLDALEEKKA